MSGEAEQDKFRAWCVWSKEFPTYNPYICGSLSMGQTVTITFIPPSPATLRFVRLVSPPDTWIRGLVVSGEQCVDPSRSILASVLDPMRRAFMLDLPVGPGGIVELQIERMQ